MAVVVSTTVSEQVVVPFRKRRLAMPRTALLLLVATVALSATPLVDAVEYVEGEVLRVTYEWPLFFVATALSFFAMFSGLFALSLRTGKSGRRNNLLLIVSCLVITTVGMWDTFFIGMSYVSIGEDTNRSYNLSILPLAYFASFAMNYFGIQMVFCFAHTRHWRSISGGTVMTVALMMLFYSGVWALSGNFTKKVHGGWVVLAVLTAMVLVNIPMRFYASYQQYWRAPLKIQAVSAAALALAVVTTFFCVVESVTFYYTDHVSVEGKQITGKQLETDVGMWVTILVVCMLVWAFLVMRLHNRRLARLGKLQLSLLWTDSQGRILVTLSDTLPTVVIDNVGDRTLTPYGFDFLRFVKTSFNWDDRTAQKETNLKIHSKHPRRMPKSSMELYENFVNAAERMAAKIQVSVRNLGVIFPRPIIVSDPTYDGRVGQMVVCTQQILNPDSAMSLTKTGRYKWAHRNVVVPVLYNMYGRDASTAGWIYEAFHFIGSVTAPISEGLYVGFCYSKITGTDLEILVDKRKRNIVPTVRIGNFAELDPSDTAFLSCLVTDITPQKEAKFAERIKEHRAIRREELIERLPVNHIYVLSDMIRLDTASDLIRDHQRHGITLRRCFSGKALIDWMLKNDVVATRQDGMAIGREMAEVGLLKHVLDCHEFSDSSFYLFRLIPYHEEDEDIGSMDLPFEERFYRGLAVLADRLGTAEHLTLQNLYAQHQGGGNNALFEGITSNVNSRDTTVISSSRSYSHVSMVDTVEETQDHEEQAYKLQDNSDAARQEPAKHRDEVRIEVDTNTPSVTPIGSGVAPRAPSQHSLEGDGDNGDITGNAEVSPGPMHPLSDHASSEASSVHPSALKKDKTAGYGSKPKKPKAAAAAAAAVDVDPHNDDDGVGNDLIRFASSLNQPELEMPRFFDITHGDNRRALSIMFSHQGFRRSFPEGYDKDNVEFINLNNFEIFYSSLKVVPHCYECAGEVVDPASVVHIFRKTSSTGSSTNKLSEQPVTIEESSPIAEDEGDASDADADVDVDDGGAVSNGYRNGDADAGSDSSDADTDARGLDTAARNRSNRSGSAEDDPNDVVLEVRMDDDNRVGSLGGKETPQSEHYHQPVPAPHPSKILKSLSGVRFARDVGLKKAAEKDEAKNELVVQPSKDPGMGFPCKNPGPRCILRFIREKLRQRKEQVKRGVLAPLQTDGSQSGNKSFGATAAGTAGTADPLKTPKTPGRSHSTPSAAENRNKYMKYTGGREFTAQGSHKVGRVGWIREVIEQDGENNITPGRVGPGSASAGARHPSNGSANVSSSAFASGQTLHSNGSGTNPSESSPVSLDRTSSPSHPPLHIDATGLSGPPLDSADAIDNGDVTPEVSIGLAVDPVYVNTDNAPVVNGDMTPEVSIID